MDIRTVSVIGLGTLGTMYAHHLHQRMPGVRIIADEARITRYRRTGIMCNGTPCDFRFIAPGEAEPADLLIFAVKQGGLADAIETAKDQVGENTIVLSLLNGISSERMIAQAYGEKHVLLCVAQAMDALMKDARLTYRNLGLLVFGDREAGAISDKTRSIADFFTRMEVPHRVNTDMQRYQWGKFMFNTGINQAIAVYGESYADVQKQGIVRDVMLAAMEEVRMLSQREGINLTEQDMDYWLGLVPRLNPVGKPSTRQDVEAKRLSEVELFSGTVLALAKKHGLDTPVNRDLYERITNMERGYAGN